MRVETHKFQYLYPEGDTYHFMNVEDYDQITLQKSTLDSPDLLKEGEVVTVIINSEKDSMPLSVEMPASVVLEVVATEPGVKGNTATNTFQLPLETGAIVNVPLFINEGDKIKVKKGTYKERIKQAPCEISDSLFVKENCELVKY